MADNGLPVNNIVGTNVELGSRSTADAANAASSSQAADSAAASADAAWKFSNAAAAMTSAVSKVATADQSVASTLLLTKPVRLSSASNATGFIPDTAGAWVAWNRKTASDDGLTGGTDFINHKGTFNGGWNFWSTDGKTINLSTRINWDGSIKTMGGIISHTDQIMQAGGVTPNLLLRLRDKDGIEKGALYSQTDTGQLNLRWNGSTYTLSLKPDGTATFPSTVFSGTTPLLKTGDYGVGNTSAITVADTESIGVNQFFRYSPNTPGAPNTGAWAGLQGGYDGASRWVLGMTMGVNTVNLYARCRSVSSWGSWVAMWHSGNTTVDANGFIKKASPIVQLFGDGTSQLNEQSQGVTTERVSEGVYRVSGTLGFNSDSAWGGPNGGIGLPKDNNDLTLVWVDYEVDETGDLLIKTFHRINSTAPKFAQNVKTGYKEGQPIDIPVGRWIDLRVEMPGVEEPEFIPDPELEVMPDSGTESAAVDKGTEELNE